MKKVYIIIIVLIAVLSVSGYISYNKNQEFMNTRPISIDEIQINNQKISYMEYNITHEFSKGKFKKQRNFVNQKEIMQTINIKDTKLNINSNSDFNVRITSTSNNEVIFEGNNNKLNDFAFSKKDSYLINVIQNYKDDYGKGKVKYIFKVSVDETPTIHISNEKPKQGELVKVDVNGIFDDTNVKIEGEFIPSNSFYNNGKKEIYVPITYYKDAIPYKMKVLVNDVAIPFTLDVQKEQFSQVHFTVDQTVTNNTVNNANANIEYRNKIHPLYKTRDENKYFEGKFIKPVEEKRISSTFGQERYVNNAKTPSRHSGIDYAAPEGTPVYATNNGKVEFSEFVQLTGNTIVIDHGLGIKSYHFHLSELNVKNGDVVKKGQLIGKVGTTGFSTGPHLHFQMSIENQPINPAMLYNIEF